ncbi:MAG TPA: 5'-3' exonuclease H3TH domain-containing protein [Steroidobacteraceae bacterium]|nr:5'-3' exonuclease H3TH domain-containing protein [Steroidobacteraceae bacterium]
MIYLIDASVYVFRAYYAMPPDMTDRDGNPSHATFGFARFLGDLVERAQPHYIAVAFDASLTTSFRNQIYPAYKANRDPAPEDLKLQFERCQEFCRYAGIPSFAHNEYEADDIVGSLMTLCRAQGLPATLVTRDKDFAQLIRAGDIYWDYTDNAKYLYHQIEERFGVAPERFADFLALMGDSVDNIKGVPGVGPKTAAALMKEFASLEELYDNLDLVAKVQVRGAAKLAAKLLEHREAAFLARRLTEIACHMPLEILHTDLTRRAPDMAALTDFFDRHNFGPMLRRQAERLSVLKTGAAIAA